MIFDITIDPYKKLDVIERLQNFADGMEKATMNRSQEVLEYGRRRTIREMELSNASRRSTFYRAIGVDPASMERTAETITGSLYIDDTYTAPINAFTAEQTDKGVMVYLNMFGDSRIFYEGAFGPEIPRLGRNIYKRITRKRLPIEKIADLKLVQLPGVREHMRQVAQEMRTELIQRIGRDKTRLIREFEKWHSQ